MSGFDNQFRTDQAISQSQQFYDSQRYASDRATGKSLQQMSVMDDQRVRTQLMSKQVESNMRAQEVSIEAQFNQNKLQQLLKVDEVDFSREKVKSLKLANEKARWEFTRQQDDYRRNGESEESSLLKARLLQAAGGVKGLQDLTDTTWDPLTREFREQTDEEKAEKKARLEEARKNASVSAMREERLLQQGDENIAISREKLQSDQQIGSAKVGIDQARLEYDRENDSERTNLSKAQFIADVLKRDELGQPSHTPATATAALRSAGIELTPMLQSAVDSLGPKPSSPAEQAEDPAVQDFMKKLAPMAGTGKSLADVLSGPQSRGQDFLTTSRNYVRHRNEIRQMFLEENAAHPRRSKFTGEEIDGWIAGILKNESPEMAPLRAMWTQIIAELK